MRIWKLVCLGIFAEDGHAPRAGTRMTGRGHLHFKTDFLLVLFFCFWVTTACRIRWFEKENSTSKKDKKPPNNKQTNRKQTTPWKGQQCWKACLKWMLLKKKCRKTDFWGFFGVCGCVLEVCGLFAVLLLLVVHFFFIFFLVFLFILTYL